jgi:hypothetical protein
MKHDYLGVIELEDGYARLERRLGDREVEIEIEAGDGEPEAAELNALASACQSHQQLCDRVRARVTNEYRDLSVYDGFSVWIEDDPGLLAQLDPAATTLEDVTGERYAQLLELSAIRLRSAGGDEPGTIIFDLRFGLAEPIDYLIAATFSVGLDLLEVALES